MNNLKENLLHIFTFNLTGSCFITLKKYKNLVKKGKHDNR